MSQLIGLARVAGNGAVLLGKTVAADGYANRRIRVVTHAHHDHIIGLRRSIRDSLFIMATPTTHAFLEVLGYGVPDEKKLSVSYDRPIDILGETIVLKRANHIAGSSVVVVEGPNYRVAYTGDFKVPGTDPVDEPDVLVVDATYGDPRRQRTWKDWQALERLIDLVTRSLNHGPVWIYGYHGKLQEVMVSLRMKGVKAPFYADPVTARLAEIAARFYSYDVSDIHKYVGGPVDEPVLVFVHARKSRFLRRMPGTHILLSGWEVRSIVRRVSDNYYVVSFSDHATLPEVLEYVLESRPRVVVVDGYRSRDAAAAAKYIERHSGIPAIAMP